MLIRRELFYQKEYAREVRIRPSTPAFPHQGYYKSIVLTPMPAFGISSSPSTSMYVARVAIKKGIFW